MLTNIILRDFKGLNGTFSLTPRTVMTGPNGSGKSGLLDAYRILVTGYTGLGKAPAATHLLASGKTTEVTGTLEDGTIITRRFEKKGSAVTQTISVNGKETKAADYCTPPALVMPAESLHPNEFLTLSGDKRAAWLSDNLKMTVGPVAPDLFADIEKVAGQSINYEEPLDKVFTILAERESILKKEVELCQANIKRLMGQDNQLPAGTLAEWQEKLRTAEADLEKLTSEQAKNDERAKLASAKMTHRQRLTDQIKQGKQKLADTTSKIGDLNGRLAAIGAERTPDELRKLQNQDAGIRDRMSAIRPEIKRLRDGIKSIRDHKQCPTCSTDAEFLGDTLDDWDFKAAGLEGELEVLQEEQSKSAAQIRDVEQGINNATIRKELGTEIRVLTDAVESYKSTLKTMQADLEKAEADTEMPAVESTVILTARIDGLRVQKKEIQDSIKKFTAAQSVSETRIRAEQDRQDAEKKLDDLKSLIRDLKKARDIFLEKATSAIISPFRTAVSAAFPMYDAYLQIVNDKGKPEVDFGVVKNCVRISFDTLSGGEKLVILCALVASLQIARCGRPSVCLLEMAEADQNRLDSVAAACGAIGFDQVILATCHEPKPDFDVAWTVMKMGGAN